MIRWCVSLYLSTDFSYIPRLFIHISLLYNTTTLFRFASASAQRLGTFTLDMRTLIDFSLTYLLTTSPSSCISVYCESISIHCNTSTVRLSTPLQQALLRKS